MIADDFRGDPSERLEEEPDLAEDRFLIQGLNSPSRTFSASGEPGTTCSVRRRIWSGLIRFSTRAVSGHARGPPTPPQPA